MTATAMKFQARLYAPSKFGFRCGSNTFPAGIPLDVLQGDWWVPGSTGRADAAKYVGKPQWKEILTCTPEATMLWASRALQDHWSYLVCLFYKSIGAALNKTDTVKLFQTRVDAVLFQNCCWSMHLRSRLGLLPESSKGFQQQSQGPVYVE